MFKAKHVVFRTTADVDEARRLLEASTVRGSPSPDDLVGTLKDTLTVDKTPFRGEVEGNRFRLTRRRRGRRVRIQLQGSLEPRPEGGTEIRASMSPPRSLTLSLLASVLALLVLTGGSVAAGGPSWLPLLALLAQLPVAALTSWLYAQETSATFSALRDTLPERAMPQVAPTQDGDERVAQRESERVG